MHKSGLVIIFNHKYEKNIPLLKELYGKRFKNILFIMPFHKGDNNDVIPVYESSFCFEGYIAQAHRNILKMQCDHYVFIGDDLLLSPKLNEDNIGIEFCLSNNDAYIESLTPLKYTDWPYDRFNQAFLAINNPGVNYKQEIPQMEEAVSKAKEYGFDDISIGRWVHTHPYKISSIRRRLDRVYNTLFHPLNIDYPLVTGYSDFIILPRDKIASFSQMMGVFAAIGLHAEIAIPTGLMLSFSPCNLKTQKDIQMKTNKMWMPNTIATEFENKCKFKLDNIEKCWPQEYAYIHPIKLSKWNR